MLIHLIFVINLSSVWGQPSREQDERGRVEFAEKRMEEKTKKSNTLEIAKKFKLAGVDNNTIANSTGLSIEEIDKL